MIAYLHTCWMLAAWTFPCFVVGCFVGWFARRALKPCLVAVVLTLATSASDAGCGRTTRYRRMEVRAARIQVRAIEAQTGVAQLKWRTRMYRARTAANISGLFSPLSWLFGGVL